MTVYATYSFTDFNAAINGPGGSFILGGPDTAMAEEGVTVGWSEENNTQNIGADGSVMNSMHASRAGICTLRFQKTSPINAALSLLWNFQRRSAVFWGKNIITMRDVVRGDNYNLSGCAFVRFPSNTYGKIAGMIEWEFQVAAVDPLLGAGAADGH